MQTDLHMNAENAPKTLAEVKARLKAKEAAEGFTSLPALFAKPRKLTGRAALRVTPEQTTRPDRDF